MNAIVHKCCLAATLSLAIVAVRGAPYKEEGNAPPANILADELTRAEWKIYAMNVDRAHEAIIARNYESARKSLDACRWDFRGWEYDYLSSKMPRRVPLAGSPTAIVFMPDGRRIVSAEGAFVKILDVATGQELLALTDNAKGIRSLSVSHDGQRIAAASTDTTATIWDAATGKEVVSFRGHGKQVTAVALSPNGNLAASGGFDNKVRIWDAATGKQLHVLEGEALEMTRLGFNSDGSLLVTVGNGKVKVWNTATGEEKFSFVGAGAATFSPDGKRLVHVLIRNGRTRGAAVRDTATGDELFQFDGLGEDIRLVSYTRDGKRIVTWHDRSIKIWNANTGEALESIAVNGTDDRPLLDISAMAVNGDATAIVAGEGRRPFMVVWDLAIDPRLRYQAEWARTVVFASISPNGERIASGSDKAGMVWDARTGKDAFPLEGHEGRVQPVFSRDGKRIASAAIDQTVKLWDADSGKLLRTMDGKFEIDNGAIGGIAISEDNSRIAVGNADGTVKVWDAMTGKHVLTLAGHRKFVSGVAFSADGNRIVSSSHDRSIKVWDAGTGERLVDIKGEGRGVWSVALSRDGQRIVSVGGDQALRVWDARTGRELAVMRGHELNPRNASFSPDGKRIVSGGYDRVVRVWEASSGQELLAIGPFLQPIANVEFAGDGSRIVAVFFDKTTRSWDVPPTTEPFNLRGHSQEAISVAFSRDGKRIVSGDGNGVGIVKVWDTVTGRELLTFNGGQQQVSIVAIDPSGKRILTEATVDASLRIWDAETGRETHALDCRESGVASVVFSPDGKSFAVGGEDGSIAVWDTALGRRLRQIDGPAKPPDEDEGGMRWSRRTYVSWSADGKWLASADGASDIKIWNVVSGQVDKILKGDSGVMRLKFAGVGTRLAFCEHGQPGVVRIWDVATGKEVSSVKTPGSVLAFDFSPDGRFVAIGGDYRDGALKIWDASNGKQVAAFHEHAIHFLAVAFSGDGKQIVTSAPRGLTGPSRGEMRVWNLSKCLIRDGAK